MIILNEDLARKIADDIINKKTGGTVLANEPAVFESNQIAMLNERDSVSLDLQTKDYIIIASANVILNNSISTLDNRSSSVEFTFQNNPVLSLKGSTFFRQPNNGQPNTDSILENSVEQPYTSYNGIVCFDSYDFNCGTDGHNYSFSGSSSIQVVYYGWKFRYK